ncbi:MAG: hypothetical protein JWO87_3934 [Phycisphaerales bacterium]|nr:hypothetical protein [Phycisphaerales bacterium]MDB5302271.1 hypothetical protein [Phycisphaerales bacterium]
MTFALAQFAPTTAKAAPQGQAAGQGTNGRAPQANAAQRAGPG